MTKQWILSALLLSALCGAFPSTAGAAEEKNDVKEGPCRKVIDACKAADFAKGEKSLFKDCMLPLLAAKPVPGVNISPEVVAACKKIKESKKTKSM